jgi:non-heme chloroperoxidase
MNPVDHICLLVDEQEDLATERRRQLLGRPAYASAMAAESLSVSLGSGLTLSCAAQGDASEPALVLLPGPTDSWRSYEPVLEHLPRSIRTIAVSQRGHGDSDKPATGYQVEDFAADVVPLLDAVGIEQAVLAGHSGSCMVARRVAIDHPDRVAGLVLEASPSTLKDDPGLTEFVESVVANLGDPIDPAFARSFLVDTSSGDAAPEILDQLVGELLTVPARVWREAFAGLLWYDDLAELGRITAPVLLIWGDADSLVGRGMQDELLGRVAGATLVTYPGVGHTPRWEDPARFASDVAAFVSRARA